MKNLRLKVGIFLNRNSTVLGIIILGLFLIMVFYEIDCIYISINTILNSENSGATTTLLGAIVGGALSLLGSIIVNKQSIKGNSEIQRKREMYTPLYNELVELRNFLTSNPYKSISLKKQLPSSRFLGEFSLWLEIKNNSKILETPIDLEKMLNRVERKILEVEEFKKKCYPKIFNVYQALSNENKSIQLRGTEQAEGSYENIVNRTKKQETIFYLGLRNDMIENIALVEKLYDMCNLLPEVELHKKKFEELSILIRDAIEVLGLKISYISSKYERKKM